MPERMRMAREESPRAPKSNPNEGGKAQFRGCGPPDRGRWVPGVRNLITMLFSLLLVATTVGLAFLLRALSDDLDVTRADPGTAAEVQVP